MPFQRLYRHRTSVGWNALTLLFCLAILAAGVPAAFAQPQVTLTVSPSTSQPIGTAFNFTATATDSSSGPIIFQWSTRPSGGKFKVYRDYHPLNTFSFTPMPYDGSYDVQVTAMNNATQLTSSTILTVTATSRVTSANPVLTRVASPLMVLFSAPSCASGSSMHVRFVKSGLTVLSSYLTPLLACNGSSSMNFYVAGMMPNTTYNLDAEVVNGPYVAPGPTVPFTTGAMPSSVTIPAVTIPMPANSQTSIANPVMLHSFVSTPSGAMFPAATDLNGNVLWYYPPATSSTMPPSSLTRPVSGGTMLIIASDPTISSSYLNRAQLIREVDLAGNVVGETNVSRMWQQMQKMGATDPITALNHEAIRLPNGHTLMLCYTERLYPPGTQGSTGPNQVDVLADYIIDVDQNWQVAWFWDSFNYLNINRAAILGEVCSVVTPLCPQLFLAGSANDWTHANSLDYTSDNNLLISLRNQDWVLKLNYMNSTGNGNIIWTLGQQGNFTMNSTDPYPWFTHQHDVEFQNGSSSILTVFDNGNTRIAANPNQDSRGQVLNINQTNMTASLNLNVTLPGFARGLGSAQLLNNGNYHFLLSWQSTPSGTASQSFEVLPSNSAFNYEQQTLSITYRTFRMSDLWTAPTN